MLSNVYAEWRLYWVTFMLSVIMPSDVYAECHYAGCLYAEGRGTYLLTSHRRCQKIACPVSKRRDGGFSQTFSKLGFDKN